jgi:hypothetical protein
MQAGDKAQSGRGCCGCGCGGRQGDDFCCSQIAAAAFLRAYNLIGAVSIGTAVPGELHIRPLNRGFPIALMDAETSLVRGRCEG